MRLCTVALIVYGAQPRSMAGHQVGVRFSLPGTPVAYDDPFGLPLPARAALVASRHMHRYGTTSEQLAEVAVAIRKNANRNPQRHVPGPHHHRRRPQQPDDRRPAAQARLLRRHRRRRRASCSRWRAGPRTLAQTPGVRPRRRAPASAPSRWRGWPNWGRMVAYESGRDAFARAGITPKDVDVLQLYDAFTINVILQLEALGFCGAGRGRAPGGGWGAGLRRALPTNTDGGGLSSNHPGMRGIFLLIEAVRQLRGQSTAQVPDAEIVLCNGTGGRSPPAAPSSSGRTVMSTHPTPITSRSSTPSRSRSGTGLADGKFLLKYCLDCGQPHFYPCAPAARSPLGRHRVAGGVRATGRSTPGRRSDQMAFEPFKSADAAQPVDRRAGRGPLLLTNVVGCDVDDVHIGMAVVLAPELDVEVRMPGFRPAS